MTSNKQASQALAYFIGQTKVQALALCPITGISMQIISPAMPCKQGLILKLDNPLALAENALAVSKLAFSELLPLPTQTLAAIILSLLEHWKLRNDKLLAVEANIILSNLQPLKLIEAIRFLSSLSSYTSKRIPRLSLEEGKEQTLISWLSSCTMSLQLPPTQREEIKKQTKQRSYIDSSLSSQDRQEAKTLINSLITDSIISPKLAILFKQSYHKNQLVLMGETMRESLCKYLSRFPSNEEAVKLIALYKRVKASATQQERITAKQLDEEWGFASDSFTNNNIPSKNLSLMQIIAARKEQLERQAQRGKQATIEETVNLMHTIEEELEEEHILEEEQDFEEELEELDLDKETEGLEEENDKLFSSIFTSSPYANKLNEIEGLEEL